MPFGIRTWLFITMAFIVLEDFQYALKIETSPSGKIEIECEMQDFSEDCEGDNENKEEKEEEKKEDTKEKDNDKNDKPENLLDAYSNLSKQLFHDARSPLSDIAHELETPPPEI